MPRPVVLFIAILLVVAAAAVYAAVTDRASDRKPCHERRNCLYVRVIPVSSETVPKQEIAQQKPPKRTNKR